MNNRFDELTKSMARSLTRRAAFKKFGIGLAGMALACFGLANKAEAKGGNCLPSGSLVCIVYPKGGNTCNPKHAAIQCCSHVATCTPFTCSCA